MKKRTKGRPAAWLTGGALSLTTAASVEANLVQIEVGFSTSLWDTRSGVISFANASIFYRVNFNTSSGVTSRGDLALYPLFASTAFDVAFDYTNNLSFFSSADAGSIYGPSLARDSIVGLSAGSVNLAAGGFASGFFVVFNDAQLFGSAGITSFIYDDTNLLSPTVAADLADLASYTTVNTVALGASVPEPSSLALLAMGAGGVLLRRNRKEAT